MKAIDKRQTNRVVGLKDVRQHELKEEAKGFGKRDERLPE